MGQPVYVIDQSGNKVPGIQDSEGNVRLAVDTLLRDGDGNPITPSSPLPVSVPGSVLTAAPTYDVRIDETTTPNVTYIGRAPIGSVTSSAVWQIQKIDETSGVIITWAGSSSAFSQVWDNRASLSYG